MEAVEVIKLVLPGIPNFVGLIIGLFMLYRVVNRLLDMVDDGDN